MDPVEANELPRELIRVSGAGDARAVDGVSEDPERVERLEPELELVGVVLAVVEEEGEE